MKLLHSLILGSSQRHLIVLHGFLGMGDNWKSHAKHWESQGWCVHLIDQRNHGRSFWSTAFNYSILAKDLKAYLDHHEIQKCTLLGHSMGGKTAMFFASQNPEYITQLLVADIAPKAYPAHHQQILNGLASLDFSILKSRTQADQELSNFVPEVGVRQFLLKNLYWIKKEQLGLRINIETLKAVGEIVGEGLESHQKFDGPTLFLRGVLSGYISDQDRLILHHHFPNYTLKDVEKAGHWLHAENPTAFLNAIESWWV
ncbi:MAG: alpha/beta fold hydrolase [Flavobacteriales bacterium]|jgi:pimeloyl-ACP methyl ester carboxylesterase|nr:alpha/beta fold hydrolase [Flavobacteriaceae bacterium]MDO7581590.1 alpha/beta fold hydrolase [Flavobacteriaceae bacterium]MDO7590844.1 alpha/beta fold hydrolase [Flavobacteriaceae bacterium]MDO7598939.1 alpha/beta fold hydrolase [Flavobacteriaceae bacterium]MDO7603585.1 alpha/beta fold hydrolase [Flavobacteriaceae bacterium]|tara:strand:+ start:2804 stop:3574 length:771 start_codon:yes stop_codon:yes gene_type:complete